jgi:F0F1-type ATP synthase membrane subunit c/vacuolar-type H+-ATPase subunit K
MHIYIYPLNCIVHVAHGNGLYEQYISVVALAAGLAVGLASIGPGVGQGTIIGWVLIFLFSTC